MGAENKGSKSATPSVVDSMFEGFDMGEQGGATPSPDADGSTDTLTDNLIPGDVASSRESDETADDEQGHGQATEKKEEQKHDWQKRFKDTEKSFNEERQKRVELERRLNEFEARQQAGETTAKQDKQVTDIIKGFKEKFEDDPEAALEFALEQMERKIEQVNETARRVAQESTRESEIDRQERDFERANPDYRQFVNDSFLEVLKSSPQLVKQWQEDGGTPEAAYKMARRQKAITEFTQTGTMPDWYQSQSPSQKAKQSDPDTLSDIPSAPPPKRKNNQQSYDSLDDVTTALFRRN